MFSFIIKLIGLGAVIFLTYKVCVFVLSTVATFWEICESLYILLTSFIKVMCTPIRWITEKIKNWWERVNPFTGENALTRFSDRHPTLGTPKSIIFVLATFLFTGVLVIVCYVKGDFNIFAEAVEMLPLIYALEVVGGDIKISFISILSVGISATFIGLLPDIFMDDYEIESFGGILVSIVHYLSTTSIAAFLGLLLSGVWNWLANSGLWLFNFLKFNITNSKGDFLSWIILIGCVLAMILVIYIGIIITMIATRDFIDVICYGMVGIVILFLVGLILYITGLLISVDLFTNIVGKILFGIIIIICMFGIDYFRVNKTKLLGYDDDDD